MIICNYVCNYGMLYYNNIVGEVIMMNYGIIQTVGQEFKRPMTEAYSSNSMQIVPSLYRVPCTVYLYMCSNPLHEVFREGYMIMHA